MTYDDLDYEISRPREDQELSDCELWDRYMSIDVNDFIEIYVMDMFKGDPFEIEFALEVAPQNEDGEFFRSGSNVHFRLAEYVRRLLSMKSW